MNFARWLQRKMDENDLNQPGLAAKIRVRHSTVNRWLQGANGPEPKQIESLSRLFGVPKAEIYRYLGRTEPLVTDDPVLEEKHQRLLFIFDQLAPELQDHAIVTVAELLEFQKRAQGNPVAVKQ